MPKSPVNQTPLGLLLYHGTRTAEEAHRIAEQLNGYSGQAFAGRLDVLAQDLRSACNTLRAEVRDFNKALEAARVIVLAENARSTSASEATDA